MSYRIFALPSLATIGAHFREAATAAATISVILGFLAVLGSLAGFAFIAAFASFIVLFPGSLLPIPAVKRAVIRSNTLAKVQAESKAEERTKTDPDVARHIALAGGSGE